MLSRVNKHTIKQNIQATDDQNTSKPTPKLQPNNSEAKLRRKSQQGYVRAHGGSSNSLSATAALQQTWKHSAAKLETTRHSHMVN
jgi:hypothetical protein